MRHTKLFVSLLPWLLPMATPVATAQPASTSPTPPYPSGPIRIVVPFPPGGGTDIFARALAQKLNEAWQVPVIIDNRGGANGTIGSAYVAKSPPDGQTLLVMPSGFAVNPSIYPKLPFDTVKDFTPVSLLAEGPLVLSLHPSFPPRSVKEFTAFLKAGPGEINYGSSGNGSPPHLAAELFKLLTGVRMNHIPYKGAGPAAVDFFAGQIPVYFMNALQVTQYVRTGKVRALGVTTGKRFPPLPEVPTIAEAGVPGYALSNWYGILAPAATPRASIAKLHTEIARILNLPDIKERLTNQGAILVGNTPEEFAAFLRVEISTAAKIVKAAGMTAMN
jgi:tripartite-type tricarboxylate transporter receptor subunit TctC